MRPSKFTSGSSLLLAFFLLGVTVHADDFTVGDEQGWTTPTANQVDFYKNWTSGQNFRVNDTLRFKYNSDQHNVLVVKEADFTACLNNTPLEAHEDGDTKIKLNRSGTWYFICGYPNHCPSGQRLLAEVAEISRTNSTGAGPNKATSRFGSSSFIAGLVAAISSASIVWIFL